MSLVDSGTWKNAPAPLARPGADNGGASSDVRFTLPREAPSLWLALFDAMMRNRAYEATVLGPVIGEYLAWKRLGRAADSTLDTYERDLALLAINRPEAGVADVAHTDLAAILTESVTEGSWGRVRKSWSAFFAWAAKDGRCAGNPVERLPALRPTPTPVHDIWRQDELDLLIASTRQHPEPLIQRLRVQTMIESGARASELLGLQLGHFDLSRKTVTVTGKGRKTRLVPISGELARLVDEYFLTPYPLIETDPAQSDYLWFPMWRLPSGGLSAIRPWRPVDYRTFNFWWRRIVDAAGVRYRKPHMMRHTFATDVLDATEGDLYAVKELLGHSSTLVTEVYLHSMRTRTSAAIDRLGAYRASQRSAEVETA